MTTNFKCQIPQLSTLFIPTAQGDYDNQFWVPDNVISNSSHPDYPGGLWQPVLSARWRNFQSFFIPTAQGDYDNQLPTFRGCAGTAYPHDEKCAYEKQVACCHCFFLYMISFLSLMTSAPLRNQFGLKNLVAILQFSDDSDSGRNDCILCYSSDFFIFRRCL